MGTPQAAREARAAQQTTHQEIQDEVRPPHLGPRRLRPRRPKTKNELTCTICVDVITDIDDFITDTTTEDQIVQFFKEICHTMGTVMGSETLEAECNAMFENNLPQIIDDLVNKNLDPLTVCTNIMACP